MKDMATELKLAKVAREVMENISTDLISYQRSLDVKTLKLSKMSRQAHAALHSQMFSERKLTRTAQTHVKRERMDCAASLNAF